MSMAVSQKARRPRLGSTSLCAIAWGFKPPCSSRPQLLPHPLSPLWWAHPQPALPGTPPLPLILLWARAEGSASQVEVAFLRLSQR